MTPDRLADLLAAHRLTTKGYHEERPWEQPWNGPKHFSYRECSCGFPGDRSLKYHHAEHDAHVADALRAALADGSLPWRDVAPPEVVAVYDAAVAFDASNGGWPWPLFRAVDALPEHLRSGS